MKPLSGNRRDGKAVGHVVSEHIAPWHTTYGTTDLVADSALYREGQPPTVRPYPAQVDDPVPATLSDGQAVLRRADPQTMTPLADGYRYGVVPSTYGGVELRWVLIYSAPRHPHAQQTVNKQLLKQGAQEVHPLKQLCRTTFACEADAPQALATCAQSLRATFLHQAALRPIPRDDKQGRPGQGAFCPGHLQA